MSCQRSNAGKITVPDDLRDVLLEFTISYLLEQPGDIIDYAVDFFTRLRDARRTHLIQDGQTCSSTPDESVDEEPPVGRFASRRKSVFAETYNPEDDEEDEGFKQRETCGSITFFMFTKRLLKAPDFCRIDENRFTKALNRQNTSPKHIVVVKRNLLYANRLK